ncbi:hypothetical protein [Leptospira noguchii]|uniref:hypothetical protein n=1 Tax=Leptospira noguchii TaxID=28182 RepID=UPI001F06FEF3|nr:hypothetical protein [Leptospira noguchii]
MPPNSKVTNCVKFMGKKFPFEKEMKNPERRENFDKKYNELLLSSKVLRLTFGEL